MPGSSTLSRRSRPAILGPLGRACFRHRRLTVLTWIVGVACLITLWTRFGAPALPWLIGVVVALSMLLLVVMFRSVTVAVKAALMNLLSISAAYGALVAITQYGWLGHLFGFPEKMPVTTWVPMFLFVILFGLSMDYEVFLLSRIRESYDATGDNAASVATGLARPPRGPWSPPRTSSRAAEASREENARRHRIRWRRAWPFVPFPPYPPIG